VDELHIVKDNLFPVPPLFNIIREQSGTDWKEMYQVFNMGHRMEIYCAPALAEELIQMSRSFNIEAQVVGHVAASDKKRLTIKTQQGEFTW
jgi:phosphoribosylformylglycinamidine cyclo-ligase